MSRFLLLAMPLTLVGGLLPAAPVPPDGGKQEYYFPTRVGTMWVYDVTKRPDLAYSVTESKEKNGRYLITVKLSSVDPKDDDDSTSIVQYEVSRDGDVSRRDGA